ncbi:MAG: ARMT1-like domain-containing protein [Candidatus Bathyarchaeota archaeon]|nr:ARMT1-like domain-containing protein [Candidatus Bathyarchaeota archaeon]
MDATKLGSADEATREIALRQVMQHLSNAQWNQTTPELATNVHRIIKKVTGNVDPYSQLKEKYTRVALAFYPKLEAIVKQSEDPLLTAAKLAIAGNIIDFGPKVNVNLEQTVEAVLEDDLAVNDVGKLKESLLKSKKVLYLADNAGETVFDKLLVDELLKRDAEVTFAVKDAPILNDATFDDAEIAGITKIAHVISIGTDCTGVLFRECSPEFLTEFENCGFVISKGQGNYESLSNTLHKEIFFLLKVKCPLIAEDVGVKTGSAVLKRTYVG